LSANRPYDYIITGAGCAGLSLLVHLARNGNFRDKKILLIDQDDKVRNDRTWCFWQTGEGPFEPIVHKQWSQAWFHSDTISRLLDLQPYHYKLIRGIDFYRYCFDVIGKELDVTLRKGTVKAVRNTENTAEVQLEDEWIAADYVFNSILFRPPVVRTKDHYLLQHFKGRIIETPQPVFDPAQATLMDFRTGQQHGATFVYVMPFTPQRALVEYTLFNESELTGEEYDAGLDDYISRILGIQDYTITDTEQGVIPMTDHRFPKRDGRIIYTGTAGGQTKASSGYTFDFIQQHSAHITTQLAAGRDPLHGYHGTPARFRFYDRVLLHILRQRHPSGSAVFSDLFKKNEPRQVLRFIGNESTLLEELSVISKLPVLPFFKAALQQL